MKYTVKQLATIAGVTPRTLHYYDQIGLLRPTWVGDNNYRYYTDEALLRLQQIMLYRELDISMQEIQANLDEPEFDLVSALHTHKRTLQQRLGRMSDLLQTIDRTLLHLQGTRAAAIDDLFAGFDEARQAQYEEEIAAQYGDELVIESRARWKRYTPQEQQGIQAEGGAIYLDMVAQIGTDPASPAVQQIIARWHDHIRRFYEPTREIMEGLAHTYVTHPDFVAFFTRLHPELPETMRAAILHYCAHLPDAPQHDNTTSMESLLAKLLDDQA